MNGLSLCAGIGGLDLGIEIAFPEYRCIAAIENNPEAAQRFRQHFPEAKIFQDVVGFDGSRLHGIVDCVLAGWPCQPHSVAGKRKGTADERWIWNDIARILRETGTPFFFGENVSGMLRDAGGPDQPTGELDESPEDFVGGMGTVLRDLAEMGFVTAWGSLRAADVGASHGRARIFVLAYRGGDGRGQLRTALDLYREYAPRHQPDGRDGAMEESRSAGAGDFSRQADGRVGTPDVRCGVGQAGAIRTDAAGGNLAEEGRPVADGQGGGLRIDGSAPRRERHADQRDGDVADAGSGERRAAERVIRPEELDRQGRDADSSVIGAGRSEPVADAAGQGGRLDAGSSEGAAGEVGRAIDNGWPTPQAVGSDAGSGDVADAGCIDARQREPEDASAGTAHTGRSSGGPARREPASCGGVLADAAGAGREEPGPAGERELQAQAGCGLHDRSGELRTAVEDAEHAGPPRGRAAAGSAGEWPPSTDDSRPGDPMERVGKYFCGRCGGSSDAYEDERGFLPAVPCPWCGDAGSGSVTYDREHGGTGDPGEPDRPGDDWAVADAADDRRERGTADRSGDGPPFLHGAGILGNAIERCSGALADAADERSAERTGISGECWDGFQPHEQDDGREVRGESLGRERTVADAERVAAGRVAGDVQRAEGTPEGEGVQRQRDGSAARSDGGAVADADGAGRLDDEPSAPGRPPESTSEHSGVLQGFDGRVADAERAERGPHDERGGCGVEGSDNEGQAPGGPGERQPVLEHALVQRLQGRRRSSAETLWDGRDDDDGPAPSQSGGVLADPDDGQPEQRTGIGARPGETQGSRPYGRAERYGELLADDAGAGLEERGGGSGECAEPDASPCAEFERDGAALLADAGSGRGRRREEPGPGVGRAELRDGDDPVGNAAGGDGAAGRRDLRSGASQHRGAGGGLPLFAPGPSSAFWPDLLRARPHLAPALSAVEVALAIAIQEGTLDLPAETEPGFHRLVDGVASWLHERRIRLQCDGNMVVPLQAAVCFIELARRLGL